jgi:hypothetical protein
MCPFSIPAPRPTSSLEPLSDIGIRGAESPVNAEPGLVGAELGAEPKPGPEPETGHVPDEVLGPDERLAMEMHAQADKESLEDFVPSDGRDGRRVYPYKYRRGDIFFGFADERFELVQTMSDDPRALWTIDELLRRPLDGSNSIAQRTLTLLDADTRRYDLMSKHSDDLHGTIYRQLNAEMLDWLSNKDPKNGGGSRYADVADKIGENCEKYFTPPASIRGGGHEVIQGSQMTAANNCFKAKSKALAEFFVTRISTSSDHYVGRIIFAVGPMLAGHMNDVMKKPAMIHLKDMDSLQNKFTKVGETRKNMDDPDTGRIRIITHAELRKLYRLWYQGTPRERWFFDQRVHWFYYFGFCDSRTSMRSKGKPCTHAIDCGLGGRCEPEGFWTEDTAPWQKPRTKGGRNGRTWSYQMWEHFYKPELKPTPTGCTTEDQEIFMADQRSCIKVKTIFDDTGIGGLGIVYEEGLVGGRPVIKSLNEPGSMMTRGSNDCGYGKNSAKCKSLAFREYGHLIGEGCILASARVGTPPNELELDTTMPKAVFEWLGRGDICKETNVTMRRGLRDMQANLLEFDHVLFLSQPLDALSNPERREEFPLYWESYTNVYRHTGEPPYGQFCKARTMEWLCPGEQIRPD